MNETQETNCAEQILSDMLQSSFLYLWNPLNLFLRVQISYILVYIFISKCITTMCQKLFSLFFFILTFSQSELSQAPHATVRQSVRGLTWRNGVCMTGSYTGEVNLAGVPDGHGTYYCFTHTYTGEWMEGLRHGQGVNTYTYGDMYRGDWVDDIRWIICSCSKHMQKKRGPNVTLVTLFACGNILS